MMQKEKHAKKNHSRASAVVVVIMLVIGLSMLLYPTAADYINTLKYKKDIENYQHTVQHIDNSEIQAMLAAAQDFNERLLAGSLRIGELSTEMENEYNSLLNISGTGMMGYVQIDKIEVYLPIYHGTSEGVLQTGIGHVRGSSLPVGGTGTHSILTGHTGLTYSKLFSNIDQLETGDIFKLHIPGRVLTYRVASSVVLLPEEAEKQVIDPNADTCTLMTCTPYGINSHRLLVTGVRIEIQDAEHPAKDIENIHVPVPLALKIAGIALAAVLSTAVVIAVLKRRRT